jgi:hypothetical protein
MAESPEYQALIAQGYAPDAARQSVTQATAEQSGVMAGIVDAAVNHIGGQVLGKILTEGGRLLPRIAKGAATEGATEFVQSGGEQVAQNLATQKNVDPNQPLGEGVLENMIQGLIVGGVTGGAFSGFAGTAHSEHAAKQAEQSSAMLGQVMQLAAASKLRERDAASFEGFLQSATEDGPLEKVYLNPKEAQAGGLDLTQLAQVAPSIAPQIQQALQTGQDIAIPTAELATRVPGSALEQSIVEHLKTDPGGFSAAGAKAYLQTQGESVRAEVEKQLAQHQADDAFKDSMRQVEENVRAQLHAANRFTEDVNGPYASLWANFFAVQAARSGTTPMELFNRYAPRIAAQSPAGNVLEQSLATPEFKQWFAASAAVDDNGKPKVLYHGTADDFTEFKAGEAGKNVRTPASKTGFFFTDRPDVAQRYSEMRDGTQQTLPVYLSMQDPVRLTAANMKEADEKLAAGYKGDGAIVEVGPKGTPTQTVYAVKDATQIKSAIGNRGTFDANDANILHQEARGSFNPDTNTIALLKAADLSTFLHESGHFFLEVMADLATQESAPQQVKDDFAAFLRWTGVADAAAWNAMSLDEQRAHHEDFARGFEAYLFEGKAPSLEVQGLFQRFRAWLLNVYRDLSALNVHLTPEIRGVFDRMLASNEQIQLAQDARGFDALFKNKPEGMSDDEWAVYQVQANDATQEAITELESRSLRDMKWLANAKSRELAKLQKEAAARRAEVESQVRGELQAEPVYQVLAAIKEQRQSDPQDRSAVKAWQDQRDAEQQRLADVVKGEYLATAEGAATKGIERGQYLAKNKRVMANEVERLMLQWEQNHPKPKLAIPEADLEALAQLHGFTSGDELRRAIMETPPLAELVQATTDQRMLERYGDVNSPEAIERAAEEAIHNDARLKFVATEANALRKATGQPALLAQAIRQFAADIVARTRVRELRPSIYTAAEKRAARDAEKAMRDNQLQDAAVQKRNQLINAHAAKLTLEAQAEAGKIVEYLKRLNKDSAYKGIDADYVEQIHGLLERFDLRAASLTAIDKRASLKAWLEAQAEEGIEPDIPPELVEQASRTHYRNLTMEQLRGLRDTVKQIEHLGRLKKKLLTAKDQRDYEQVRDALVQSIVDNAGDKRADNRSRPTATDSAIRMFKGYVLEHRKFASLVRELDGFQDGGAVWESLVRTMNEAGDQESTMRADAAERLLAIVRPMLAGGPRGGKGQFFPAVGMSFNREERLGIALNLGNAGNLQRLLDGEGWTLAQVKSITDTLTAADWQFVQQVWDFLESFRPQIAAKEKRVYGKEPDWVEPQPLTVHTADGQNLTLKGGYYPIKYDARRSQGAEQHADADAVKQQMRGAYTSATTRRSFTKDRAAQVTGRPLLYSTDALFGGVNEIIHDLAWHEWLIDANKLLRSKAIDNAIRERYGAEVMKQLKGAVKDIAAGEFPATHAFERGLGELRAGTVIAGLGLNILNTIINVQGLTQSMVRIGSKWTAVGIGRFAQNPIALSREVAAKSAMMANRAKTLNREVNEIQSMVRDKGKVRAAADRVMFLPLTITQQMVDLPTWWGAYQQALDAGQADARAVALADQAVLDAQSGGQVKDLAGIQRGGPLLKLWTTFYGFFNSTYNLTVESTKATDFHKPGQVLQLATNYLLLWTLPALLGTLLKNALTGGDWNEDKLAKKMIGDQISYLFGMMVGLRDVAGAAQSVAGVNEFNTGYGGPSGGRFFGEVYKLAQQAHQGEADMALFKALDNVIGILFKLPSGQLNRTVEGAVALNEGQTDNPAALFAGPPPKQ